LKEKLYSALRSKAEINNLTCGQDGLDYNVKKARNSKKNLVDKPRPYSKKGKSESESESDSFLPNSRP
ncbi:39020_t:CDS:2, partial [Gigaspora margarita]